MRYMITVNSMGAYQIEQTTEMLYGTYQTEEEAHRALFELKGATAYTGRGDTLLHDSEAPRMAEERAKHNQEITRILKRAGSRRPNPPRW